MPEMKTLLRGTVLAVVSVIALACVPGREAGTEPTATPTTVVVPTPSPTRDLAPTPTGTVARPTATPLPPTATPAPTATNRFYPLSLREIANADITENYASAPLGNVTFGEVPFKLGQGRSFTSQADPLPNNPPNVLLPADVPSPRAVYLLITGGDLWSQYAGSRIGRITMRFASGETYGVDLIAGENIREWKQGEGVVSSTTAPSVAEVWRDTDTNGPTPAIIDMLAIDVPPARFADRLVGVELADDSSTTLGSLDPAINLLGVTVLGE